MRFYDEMGAKRRQAKRMDGDDGMAANKEKPIEGICLEGHLQPLDGSVGERHK